MPAVDLYCAATDLYCAAPLRERNSCRGQPASATALIEAASVWTYCLVSDLVINQPMDASHPARSMADLPDPLRRGADRYGVLEARHHRRLRSV